MTITMIRNIRFKHKPFFRATQQLIASLMVNAQNISLGGTPNTLGARMLTVPLRGTNSRVWYGLGARDEIFYLHAVWMP